LFLFQYGLDEVCDPAMQTGGSIVLFTINNYICDSIVSLSEDDHRIHIAPFYDTDRNECVSYASGGDIFWINCTAVPKNNSHQRLCGCKDKGMRFSN